MGWGWFQEEKGRKNSKVEQVGNSKVEQVGETEWTVRERETG